MEIKQIKRPWTGELKYGKRYSKASTAFYSSSIWQNTRKSFILGYSLLPNGKPVSNALCYRCAEKNITKEMHAVDHIQRVEDGGSKTDHSNLMSLCRSCHESKSAKEKNEIYKK